MPATSRPAAVWNLRSEHSGAFVRLQRMLEGRRSFALCFLTYSDSAYRDRVADFLAERLCARVRVTIDPDAAIGTEALFEKLSADRRDRPAQLIGLERWPEGLDDLLARLNYRRGALAERCTRPLLVWIQSQHLRSVATRAADLWAWRSGTFDFTLPADTDAGIRLLEALRIRTEEELPVYERLGDVRARAVAQGRIADILQARGELDKALRIRIEEELPVYERLGDVRACAIAQARIADILAARGRLDEALRIYEEDVLPALRTINNQKEIDWARGRIESLRSSRARSADRGLGRG